MGGPVEWIYEEKMWLPFGWRLIRIKKKFRFISKDLPEWNLYQKKEIEPGTFREKYVRGLRK